MGIIIKYSLKLVFAFIIAGIVSTSTTAVQVITHPEVSDKSLTKVQLRRIYTMRQLQWNNETSIKVFVLPSQHPLHKRFAKEQLQIFPYQLNRIWHKLTYSGLGVAPTIVSSEAELITAVENTPGAIGYIEKRSVIGIDEAENKTKNTEVLTNLEVSSGDEVAQGNSRGAVNVIKIK